MQARYVPFGVRNNARPTRSTATAPGVPPCATSSIRVKKGISDRHESTAWKWKACSSQYRHRCRRRFSGTEIIPFISVNSPLVTNILGTARENARPTAGGKNNDVQFAMTTAGAGDRRN